MAFIEVAQVNFEQLLQVSHFAVNIKNPEQQKPIARSLAHPSTDDKLCILKMIMLIIVTITVMIR